MADKIPTSKVGKAQYRNYWKKACEFREAMRQSAGCGNWNAASLNAIHAAISANDALLVCFHGMRSISPKHNDAVKLLVSLVKHEKVKNNSAHLRRLINVKNIVEYEGRLFSRAEAHSLAKHTERFISWVESMLPCEGGIT